MTQVDRIPVGVTVTSDAHGGGEKYLQDLFTHPVIAERFSATLLGRLPNWASTGLPSVDLGLGPKWSYRNGPAELARGLRAGRRARSMLDREVERRRIELLHMQYKREQISLSRRGAATAAVVWTEHGRLPGGPLRGPLIAAYRRAARNVSAIVCVSPTVADEVDMVLGPGGPRRVVIENAVDAERIRPADPTARQDARARIGVSPDGPVVAMVSRIAPTKRAALAVEAVRQLPDASLLICGDGPSLEALRADTAGRERVTLTGFLRDTSDAYHSADVLLLPTDGSGEGLPLALLEAACAGVPAVVVAGSGLEPLVHGWGEVAATASPDDVAEAVSRALSRDGADARAWGLRHGFDDWAAAHADIFTTSLR